ncbi:MAG: hypothetical protein WC989_09835 [Micavibrio sp.]
MQLIPPDWQFKIGFHIDSMDEALNEGSLYTPFTAATGIHETFNSCYAIACNHMVDYIETYFGSVEAFDSFLKADIQALAHKSSLTIDMEEQWTDYRSITGSTTEQAHHIKRSYAQLYLNALKDISTALLDQVVIDHRVRAP